MKDLEPLTLEKIPEIWEAYKEENWNIPQDPGPREKWIERLYQSPVYHFSVPYEKQEDDIRLGVTITFDNLVAPFVIDLVENSNTKRLDELFDWFEELANDENTEIRTSILGVTICESFVSNAEHFAELFPFVKKRPFLFAEIRNASKRLRLSAELKTLLQSAS